MRVESKRYVKAEHQAAEEEASRMEAERRAATMKAYRQAAAVELSCQISD